MAAAGGGMARGRSGVRSTLRVAGVGSCPRRSPRRRRPSGPAAPPRRRSESAAPRPRRLARRRAPPDPRLDRPRRRRAWCGAHYEALRVRRTTGRALLPGERRARRARASRWPRRCGATAATGSPAAGRAHRSRRCRTRCRGAPLSASGGVGFDPVCTVKNAGPEDLGHEHHVLPLPDRGTRGGSGPLLTDRKLDPKAYAANPDVRYEYLGTVRRRVRGDRGVAKGAARGHRRREPLPDDWDDGRGRRLRRDRPVRVCSRRRTTRGGSHEREEPGTT